MVDFYVINLHKMIRITFLIKSIIICYYSDLFIDINNNISRFNSFYIPDIL